MNPDGDMDQGPFYECDWNSETGEIVDVRTFNRGRIEEEKTKGAVRKHGPNLPVVRRVAARQNGTETKTPRHLHSVPPGQVCQPTNDREESPIMETRQIGATTANRTRVRGRRGDATSCVC